MAACFLTSDYPRISRFFLAQFSPEKQAIIRSAKRLFTENILKMLRGYFILFLLTFAELFAGFLILRMEYAAVLALLIAVLDILPVVGTGTVLLPWAAVQLLLGQGTKALQLVGLYLVITVVRNVLEPRVIGRQVGLPPIVTLVAMFATKAKGPRYLEMAEGYVTKIALNKEDEIIGYEFINFGKMMDAIKKGVDPVEAMKKAQGHYGQWDAAVKYIDPRKD